MRSKATIDGSSEWVLSWQMGIIADVNHGKLLLGNPHGKDRKVFRKANRQQIGPGYVEIRSRPMVMFGENST